MVMTMVPMMVPMLVMVMVMVIQWDGRVVIAAFWIRGGVVWAMTASTMAKEGTRDYVAVAIAALHAVRISMGLRMEGGSIGR